jgi:hypothetical protein
VTVDALYGAHRAPQTHFPTPRNQKPPDTRRPGLHGDLVNNNDEETMMKAYEIFPTWSEIPVTIFAHDAEQAERLFREWVAAYFRHQPTTIESIYPFAGDALAARPLLARAAALDVPGIAYRDPRKHGWTIAQPMDEPCGEPHQRSSGEILYEDETDDVAAQCGGVRGVQHGDGL